MLLSAGLLRERGATSDRADPDAEHARLIAHFDRVIEILTAQSAASLDRAVARLGDPAARERLALRRGEQIARLLAYRDAGRFPRNEDPLAPVEPIFVDEHETACAVGWLMLQDGQRDEVYAIARGDNHVYVDDVETGSLLDWVATSGLTREEAALIQPGYSPPRIGANTFEALLGGGSLVSSGVNGPDGLRYENFELERISPTLPLSTCLATPGATGCHAVTDPSAVAPLDQIGAAAGAPYIQTPDVTIRSTLSNLLYLGDGSDDNVGPIYVATDLMGNQAPTCFACTSYFAVRIGFDVVVVDAGLGISAAALFSSAALNGNLVHPYDNDPAGNALHTQTSLVLRSTFASDGALLGALVIGDQLADISDVYSSPSYPLLDAYDSLSFAPVPRLHVETTAYLLDDNRLTGFFHEFQVVPVPSPASGPLLAAGFAGLAWWKRRTRVKH
ncbi:MAG TPA: hypothetical protein VKH41_09885 [Myxococcota bacterium]|nr:hypothetical protein [Myxococcota bacterium]